MGDNGTLIYSSDLHSVKDKTIDLSRYGTPCRYRFIDCKAFLKEKKLNIYEFSGSSNSHSSHGGSPAPYPPNVNYTAISYTWRGNETTHSDPSSPSYWKDTHGTFEVKGAEDGDPISLDVLKHVCTAVESSSRYIWLDRLCILQSNKTDKSWQISRMYAVYASCKMCCVLPGGIRRLVRLKEKTSWIHRGWTLQEVVVPKQTIVLVRWDHRMEGKRIQSSGGGGGVFLPKGVIDGQSMYTNLHDLLEVSIRAGSFQIDDKKIPISVKLFGSNHTSAATLLDSMPKTQHTSTYVREQSIWRSALLRTSSRPVDMVFSIMGLFGVSLDPGSFDKDDRVGATIALAREILKQGKPASWIGAGYMLERSRAISTFPRFPETSVSGQAYLRMSDGTKKSAIEMFDPKDAGDYLSHVPGGSMDKHGYVKLVAHATGITKGDSRKAPIHGDNGSFWYFLPASTNLEIATDEPARFIVYIGSMVQSSSPVYARADSLDSLRALLIKEHAPGKFHCFTFAKLANKHKKQIQSLPKMTLAIGGPNPP
ncbi:hypothetical protein D9757_000431 [Collybiopsis confluens]|uniref:Heterokaryon incompatibility domain-containing protein n=1 Tax=Collybiopsis confluens TaxID=2823264 RepID=A0A8H5I2A8_9AGAR|nr:hypothetical protein D9757_000431 [Collybiopsis confluens]